MKNWTTFTKRISINAPLEAVYRCWTTKKQLESWFLERADFNSGDKQLQPDELAKKGDHFIWKWNNWDVNEEGQILEANGENNVTFTFGKGGIVSIILKASGGMTEVTLTQDDIPTDEDSKMEIYVGCSTGWTFWLTNLKAYLEHNIILNAKGLKQNETSNLVNS